MATLISGSTGIDKIQDGTITNADINSSAAIAGSKINGSFGKVLQVVQITSNSQTSPTTSFADMTGADITITPSATSSKILVMWNCGGMSEGANNEIYCRILRDSTVIRDMDRYGYVSTSSWSAVPIFLQYLDSPSTTSAINYSIQFRTSLNAELRLNSNATTAGLVGIAMEIGA